MQPQWLEPVGPRRLFLDAPEHNKPETDSFTQNRRSDVGKDSTGWAGKMCCMQSKDHQSPSQTSLHAKQPRKGWLFQRTEPNLRFPGSGSVPNGCCWFCEASQESRHKNLSPKLPLTIFPAVKCLLGATYGSFTYQASFAKNISFSLTPNCTIKVKLISAYQAVPRHLPLIPTLMNGNWVLIRLILFKQDKLVSN